MKNKLTKYLRVLLDQHLRLSEHIEYITKRIHILMLIFYEMCDIFTKKIFNNLLNSLIESIIRYCNIQNNT